jgi:hypothetical protein
MTCYLGEHNGNVAIANLMSKVTILAARTLWSRA